MFEAERAVLDRLGFRVVAESDYEVVAMRSRWCWDCVATNMTFVVFLRATGPLCAANMSAERGRMMATTKEVDPFPLPFGFQHGRVAFPIYIADSVAPDARQFCQTAPPVEFGTWYFPVAVDRSTGEAFYLRTTPLFGAVYFAKFRGLVMRILNPAVADPEPVSVLGAALSIIMVLALLSVAVSFVQVFALLLE